MRLQVESAKCKQSFNLLISAETSLSNSAYFENNLFIGLKFTNPECAIVTNWPN